MHHLDSRQMTITWKVTPLTITDEGMEPPRCGDCEVELSVHQPDEDRPEHLLGTCDACGTWYLIEVSGDGTKACLFDLPNVEVIRKSVAESRPAVGRKRRPKRPAGAITREGAGGRVA